MNDKIQQHHLDRAAYVYVRQSTNYQVRHNHQGRQRQYDLAAQAKEFSFSSVVVIDDDQGKSGSGLVERPGFQTLLSAVCGSEVGAIFALEASRLARNNRDWHHLIDLCALTQTLIIDGEGVYDPRQLNDRLLLGLKGTMSEFELGLFRERARKAFEMKVGKGHALWEMPVGLVRNEEDRVEKIADRQVQEAIEGVFRKFRELGSARQATLWYRDEKVLLPEVVPGTRGQQVVWRLPRGQRINQILKNPGYAGALAYGRTEGKMSVDQAVVGAVLEAIQPAGIQAALDARNQFGREQDEKLKSLELALEKARYEVDRTRRQYDLVDPANRLVAGELEARWNRAMEHVAELERQCSQWGDERPELTQEEKSRLSELGRDLPTLWNHPEASTQLKKRILRTVVEEIVIGDDDQRLNHLLVLHWKGGVHTELKVPRNTVGKKPMDTDKSALELIEELSKVCRDQTIAAILNRLGYVTGGGKTWRLHSVQNTRSYHRLKNHRNTGEWLTIELASQKLQVSHTVIRRLIREETLPAKQLVPTTPWIIADSSLSLPEVQEAAKAVRQGRQLPRNDPHQPEFPLK